MIFYCWEEQEGNFIPILIYFPRWNKVRNRHSTHSILTMFCHLVLSVEKMLAYKIWRIFPPSSGQIHASFQEGTWETPDLFSNFPKCRGRSEAYSVKEKWWERLWEGPQCKLSPAAELRRNPNSASREQQQEQTDSSFQVKVGANLLLNCKTGLGTLDGEQACSWILILDKQA